MLETKTILEMPISEALKKDEKTVITEVLLKAFESAEIPAAKIVDVHYRDKRAQVEPLYIVFEILSAAANITTIVVAIWTFLKAKDGDKEKEVNLSINDFHLRIKGSMSREEIIEIIKEARKTATQHKKAS